MSPMPRCIHCARGPWVNDDGTGIRTYRLSCDCGDICSDHVRRGCPIHGPKEQRRSRKAKSKKRVDSETGGPSKTASPSI